MHSLARKLALLGLFLALPAMAQEFPSRPILLICPWPAGGSPNGIAGPRGMEPRIVKILHDGFKKVLDDPEHLKVLDQLDQELWYQSSEDYAKYARETLQKERALIERLGLLAK